MAAPAAAPPAVPANLAPSEMAMFAAIAAACLPRVGSFEVAAIISPVSFSSPTTIWGSSKIASTVNPASIALAIFGFDWRISSAISWSEKPARFAFKISSGFISILCGFSIQKSSRLLFAWCHLWVYVVQRLHHQMTQKNPWRPRQSSCHQTTLVLQMR